jgi:hypothetical protein
MYHALEYPKETRVEDHRGPFFLAFFVSILVIRQCLAPLFKKPCKYVDA